jgi:DNA-directed RNA polymerase specialized sigma24 family protein
VAVHDRAQPRVRPAPRRPGAPDRRRRQLSLVAAPVSADPADRAVAREELDRVVAEIGRLPERQRLALVRRELDGRSHRELAVELSTTVAGTKSLLVRARTTLGEAVAA